MSPELKEIRVKGVISQAGKQFTLTADDGTQYILSAIMPWESVSPDYGTEKFALHIGKRAIAAGMTDGHTIWKTQLAEYNKLKSKSKKDS